MTSLTLSTRLFSKPEHIVNRQAGLCQLKVDRMIFGTYLRALRNEKCIGLEDLAAAVGLSPLQLSRLERGRDAPPSEDVIKAIARTLGVDAQHLIQTGRSSPDPVGPGRFVAYRKSGWRR
jgi:DNA-binding Xre family transcriptional regulator